MTNKKKMNMAIQEGCYYIYSIQNYIFAFSVIKKKAVLSTG